MANVTVIGAGVAGLSCSRELTHLGHRVTVLEKSRSLAGRCASRLFEGAVIDTGAQYFTAEDDGFLVELERSCGDAIRALKAPVLGSDGKPLESSAPKLYHAAGNNRLGRALAAGLEIRMESEVRHVDATPGAESVDGRRADAVVITTPGPQAHALLGHPAEARDACGYDACLTAAFAYRAGPGFELPGAYARRRDGADLAWWACENHKCGRVPDGLAVFVAQAGPAFSAANFDAPRDAWAAALRRELEGELALAPGGFVAEFTHRWRYAIRHGDAAPARVGDSNVFLCGDSVCPSRVEAAWLSGLETARAVERVVG